MLLLMCTEHLDNRLSILGSLRRTDPVSSRQLVLP